MTPLDSTRRLNNNFAGGDFHRLKTFDAAMRHNDEVDDKVFDEVYETAIMVNFSLAWAV
jgi:hypothetical protein